MGNSTGLEQTDFLLPSKGFLYRRVLRAAISVKGKVF